MSHPKAGCEECLHTPSTTALRLSPAVPPPRVPGSPHFCAHLWITASEHAKRLPRAAAGPRGRRGKLLQASSRGRRRRGLGVTSEEGEGSTVFHSRKMWINLRLDLGKRSFPQAISPPAGASLTRGVALPDHRIGWASSARRHATETAVADLFPHRKDPNEAPLPTKRSEARKAPRLPSPHVDPSRARHPLRAAPQGPRQALRLSRPRDGRRSPSGTACVC